MLFLEGGGDKSHFWNGRLGQGSYLIQKFSSVFLWSFYIG